MYWNGVFQRGISLNALTTQHRQVIPALSFSTVRTGTLTLIVVTAGKRVIIEGLGISKL